MRKKINYLALIAVLFVSCEEYYNPDMDVVSGLLVVESHLTNDTKQNFVKLSMTRDFYSTNERKKLPVPMSNWLKSVASRRMGLKVVPEILLSRELLFLEKNTCFELLISKMFLNRRLLLCPLFHPSTRFIPNTILKKRIGPILMELWYR